MSNPYLLNLFDHRTFFLVPFLLTSSGTYVLETLLSTFSEGLATRLSPSFSLLLAGTVRPICLPFFDEELPPATPLWVIGWGFTEQDGGESWARDHRAEGAALGSDGKERRASEKSSWKSKHQGARQPRELSRAGGRRQKWERECVFNFLGKMSDTLLQASVQLIDHARCNAEDAYQGEVTEKMLCAGILEGGVDTCQVGSRGSSLDGMLVLERQSPEADCPA